MATFMIDFHTFATSNAQRVALMLEECALPYRVHWVDLMKGEQHTPAFLRINPAAAIPVIVDPDGPGGKPLTLAQSGAILVYLAEKSGRFMPVDPVRRLIALQWLFQATTDVARASGTVFLVSTLVPEKVPGNTAFFEQQCLRYLRSANERLAEREYLADELSVADFALYPLYALRRPLVEQAGDMPHLARWGAARGHAGDGNQRLRFGGRLGLAQTKRPVNALR
jgi:GSH-dependent disulfide-bond oxidoreductase